MPSCTWPVTRPRPRARFASSRPRSCRPVREWTTYAIRAVVERDGQQEVREQNVSLKAGESREISFDFERSGRRQGRRLERSVTRSLSFALIFRSLPIGTYPVGRLFLLNGAIRQLSGAGQSGSVRAALNARGDRQGRGAVRAPTVALCAMPRARAATARNPFANSYSRPIMELS